METSSGVSYIVHFSVNNCFLIAICEIIYYNGIIKWCCFVIALFTVKGKQRNEKTIVVNISLSGSLLVYVPGRGHGWGRRL